MSDSNELAEDRTDWAEDRTILANERTFAGWMRTGMASLALAVGLNAVFQESEPTWLPKLVSTLFVAVAIFIFWAAQNSAVKTCMRLDEHQTDPQPVRRVRMLAAVFAFAAVCVGGVLWAL